MLYANARLRYLAALGLPALPITIGLLACDGAGNPQPETPLHPTATATTEATATAADPIATAVVDVPTDPTAAPTAQPVTTATPTAQASVASWVPVIPPPPGKTPPGPPQAPTPPAPSCPEGNFCVASAPASSGNAAPAPFQACAAAAPVPTAPGSRSHHVTFDGETTKRERSAHPGACCYHWVILCPGGRALRGSLGAVAAAAVARRDWAAVIPQLKAAVTAEERAALAAHWEREAAAEHASIAAFARASLSLLAVGAPAGLLAETHAAAMDEVEHARAAYALASLYSGAHRGPGQLDLSTLGPVATTPAALAAETLIDGCVGESVAALALREAAAVAADPVLAEILNRIASDEEQHTQVAFRTVAWAFGEAEEEVRTALLAGVRRLEDELHSTSDEDAPEGPDLSAHGVLSPSAQRAIRRRALLDVVLPSIRALLALPRRLATAWTRRPETRSHRRRRPSLSRLTARFR
jgi:hypothetical protein